MAPVRVYAVDGGGGTLTLSVTYTDGEGNVETVSASSAIAEIAGQATLTLSAPVEEGTAVSVSSLTGDPEGDGAITNYVWQVDGTTVASGAGATSYTPVEADGGGTLTLSVTYTDGEGNVETVSASSAIAEIAGQATLTLSAPVEEGTAVSVSSLAGDPEGDGAITNYVWQVDGTTVASGAGATSYTPVEADGGGTLTLSVTYTDGEGNVETVSASSAIAEIAGQATLTLSAPVEEGTAVSVSSLTGDPEGDGARTNYVWQVDGTTVASGAGATSYTPVEADGGGTLTLSVTYTDGEGNVETVSASSAIAEIAGQATLTLSAPVEEGSTAVSVSSLAGDPEGDGAITNYVSEVDGTTVTSGAGATSYTPVEADGGGTLTLSVTYTDGEGNTETGVRRRRSRRLRARRR